MKRLLYSFLLGIVCIVGLSINALAADTATSVDVILNWNANTEEDLAGYKLYRTLVPGEYGASIATIDKTQTSFILVIPRGSADVRNFFTLTAYDTADKPRPGMNPPFIPSAIPNESPKSNEVSKLIPGIAVIQKPGMPVLTVVSDAPGELTVTWANVDDGVGGIAKIDIRYSLPSIQWGAMTSATCTSSPCRITGLLPGTMYDVRAVAYRTEANGINVFGTITGATQVATDPIVDLPPSSPTGLTIK